MNESWYLLNHLVVAESQQKLFLVAIAVTNEQQSVRPASCLTGT